MSNTLMVLLKSIRQILERQKGNLIKMNTHSGMR